MESLVNNFWRGRNVFVTGATGLLGSQMTNDLAGMGARVTCLIRDWIPSSRLVAEGGLDRVQVVRGELEDYHLLVRALNEHEIDTVFHLGAQTIVGTAARSALSTFEANIRGTWNLLEASKTCQERLERVVVASSDKAYGSHTQLPYTEDAPLQGRFPYDASKSCADLISFSYFATYGLPITVTRCGNLYGGGDLNWNRLIPGTIRSALLGERPIVRSDGRFIRDYFYVRDASQAYLRLAERMPGPGCVGEAFNFGNEEPIDVLTVVDTILGLLGRQDLTPDVRNEASNEIREQYLDCGKARRILDWSPEYTLESGLTETIAWYRGHVLGMEPTAPPDTP